MQKDNSEKLEAMRVTVDEKLHATLEKRFGESFKVVSDRLEAVHKGLGEMQTLAIGVGDLKKVLSNVKSRGIWGEAQLGNLIEEVLTPEQYEKNVKTKKSSKDNVEFAVKLPGNDEDVKQVWLPIDAKFPLEDYQLESLYAEVLRKPGLFEQIRREYRVIIAGPTTTQVILNSLQMGFRTLTIQKRSSEVWTLLSAVKTEFGKFGDLLEKTHKKIQEASNTIEGAVTKTRTIERKLNKVQNLPIAEAEKIVIEAPDEEIPLS